MQGHSSQAVRKSISVLRPRDCSAPLLSTPAPRRNLILTFLLILVTSCTPQRVFADFSISFEPFDKDNTAAANQAPSPQIVRQIKPGEVIKGELKRSESISYNIALKAGEYMRVAVDQQNRTNLSVHALDPAG